MSSDERRHISRWVEYLRTVMYDIVDEPSPLIPEPLRPGLLSAVEELDQRDAFTEVIEALRLNEEAGERVQKLEASLNRVGLLGPQLELKSSVMDLSAQRAMAALSRARNLGPPDVLDPEDAVDFDPANPPETVDQDRWAVWRRARKLLAKLLKTVDDFLGSLISAIPSIGELITEVKQALESVLDR